MSKGKLNSARGTTKPIPPLRGVGVDKPPSTLSLKGRDIGKDGVPVIVARTPLQSTILPGVKRGNNRGKSAKKG